MVCGGDKKRVVIPYIHNAQITAAIFAIMPLDSQAQYGREAYQNEKDGKTVNATINTV